MANNLQNSKLVTFNAGCVRVSCSAVSGSATRQAPLSIGFSRQEYWGGCQVLLQGIFQTRGWTRISHIAGRFFTTWVAREAPSAGHVIPKSKSSSWQPSSYSASYSIDLCQQEKQAHLPRGVPNKLNLLSCFFVLVNENNEHAKGFSVVSMESWEPGTRGRWLCQQVQQDWPATVPGPVEDSALVWMLCDFSGTHHNLILIISCSFSLVCTRIL